jgi:hypothetical protein
VSAASRTAALSGELHFQPIESLEEVDDDRGANEIHAEIAMQAKHPPEPRRARRGEHGRGEATLTRAGRGRLDQPETDQTRELGRADAGGGRELRDGEKHLSARWCAPDRSAQ